MLFCKELNILSRSVFNFFSDKDEKKKKKKEEPGSFFQRQRVDLLLGELAKRFPPKFVAPSQPEAKRKYLINIFINIVCGLLLPLICSY